MPYLYTPSALQLLAMNHHKPDHTLALCAPLSPDNSSIRWSIMWLGIRWSAPSLVLLVYVNMAIGIAGVKDTQELWKAEYLWLWRGFWVPLQRSFQCVKIIVCVNETPRETLQLETQPSSCPAFITTTCFLSLYAQASHKFPLNRSLALNNIILIIIFGLYNIILGRNDFLCSWHIVWRVT